MRAKPAVPLAGEPLVRRILRYVASHGVSDVVINLHHLPETITGRVGDGSDLGVRVRYSFESPVLGSAGGPRKALDLLPSTGFFIVNGDTLTDVDLRALAASHRETGALVTLAVMPNDRPDRYGGIVVDREGRFHGTVPRGSRVPSYHVLGVQMASPAAFVDLPPNVPAESIGALYKDLAARDRGSVRAFLCDAVFHDVGTPADYLNANRAISAAEGRSGAVGARSWVDATAELTDVIVWDDVSIGPGARLERCIVADGVNIPAGARFDNCIIMQGEAGLVVTELTG